MTYTSSEDAPFEVIPLGNFGAEAAGIDLRKPFDDGTAHYLRMILTKFQILVFRKQTLSPADQTRITRCFGDLETGIPRRPEGHQVPGHPDILYLSNKPGSPTLGYGSAWYSDGLAYARVPHSITMLHCINCPPGVGDTLFANQYGAYEAMSEYQVRDEFVYRHAWRELDVVLWENCTLLHKRADVVDFATHGLRAMHRSATCGRFEAIECEAAED